MVNEKKKNYKEKMVAEILEGLKNEGIEYVQSWQTAGGHRNYVSNVRYKGLNALTLSRTSFLRGYKETRWMTFNQIKEKELKLQAGSKGVPIVYTMAYDKEQKKVITWKQVSEITNTKQLNKQEVETRFFPTYKHYIVFNGDNIIGLEPERKLNLNNIDKEEVVERISKAMNISIKEEGERAFYSPHTDTITVPLRGLFSSQGAYARTCLHELGHATGHEKRLNRELLSVFGSETYAREELVAELTSAFMGEYLQEPISQEELTNHQAYIKSWIEYIEDDSNYFFDAVKEATRATEYMEEIALLQEWKKEKEQARELQVKNDEVLPDTYDKTEEYEF